MLRDAGKSLVSIAAAFGSSQTAFATAFGKLTGEREGLAERNR
jgi:hypothetical protein